MGWRQQTNMLAINAALGLLAFFPPPASNMVLALRSRCCCLVRGAHTRVALLLFALLVSSSLSFSLYSSPHKGWEHQSIPFSCVPKFGLTEGPRITEGPVLLREISSPAAECDDDSRARSLISIFKPFFQILMQQSSQDES